MEVSILLCNDGYIHELNRVYRTLDKPTDVLSFPMNDPVLLGDIAISVDSAERQNDNLDAELAFLAVHGCLHLLGYEDETQAGYETMMAKTQAVTGA